MLTTHKSPRKNRAAIAKRAFRLVEETAAQANEASADVARDVEGWTTDRVRQSLFDLLGQRMDGLRVLDLYAGTGALAAAFKASTKAVAAWKRADCALARR